jgi:hypothetical protein
MSDYYLADQKAAERASEHDRDREVDKPRKSAAVKVTLLGDFMYPVTEPQGCDPYNSTQGKSMGEVWATRRDRR